MKRYKHFGRYGFVLFFMLSILAWPFQAAALPSSNPAFTWQTPVTQGDTIRKASFINAREGWAVGSFKGVLHTTDGGRTWSAQRFGPPLGFLDVWFVDQHYGWVVGQGSDSWGFNPSTSMIWHTQDGGQTWNMQFYYYEPHDAHSGGLGSVYFSDRFNGWAAGRTTKLYQTTDGGLTWRRIEELPLSENEQRVLDIVSMHFPSPDTGFLLAQFIDPEFGIQKLLITLDGGASWQVEELPEYDPSDANALFQINFLNALQGWVAGWNGHIYMTRDGGRTWEERRLANSASTIANIAFIDDQTGWIITNHDGLLQTRNGGQDWEAVFTPAALPLNVLVLHEQVPVLILGDLGTGLISADGQTWETVGTGLWQPMQSLVFSTEQHGWMVGAEGAVFRTVDGGQKWNAYDLRSRDDFLKITFVTANDGWIMGTNSLFHTHDGGETWDYVDIPGAPPALNALFFLDHQTGWLGGVQGTILKTMDGGQNWQACPIDSNGMITDIQFINPQQGWAALVEHEELNDTETLTGWLLRTADGGDTWEKLPFFPEAAYTTISQIHFYSATEGLINGLATRGLGGMEGLFKTTDGGDTWQFFPPYPFPPQTPYTVHFPDQQQVLITGANGMLYASMDRAESWRILPRPTISDGIVDAAFIDDQTGWLLTSMGGVLKTGTGIYGPENELFLPFTVQNEDWETIVELTNHDGQFHNYYMVAVDREGRPIRDLAEGNLVQSGKTLWVDPDTTRLFNLSEEYAPDYLEDIAALRIYTGEDTNLNAMSAISVRYQPVNEAVEVRVALFQTPLSHRLLVECLALQDPAVQAWTPIVIVGHTGNRPMDIWLRSRNDEGTEGERLIAANIFPYAQVIFQSDVETTAILGGELRGYAAGTRTPLTGLTGMLVLLGNGTEGAHVLAGWMLRKQGAAFQNVFYAPLLLPHAEDFWSRIGYYNAFSDGAVSLLLEHYDPNGVLLKSTSFTPNGGEALKWDMPHPGFNAAAGGTVKISLPEQSLGSAWWMFGVSPAGEAQPVVFTAVQALNAAQAGTRLIMSGISASQQDTFLTLINPNVQAVAYTVTLRAQDGVQEGQVSGLIPAGGTVLQTLPRQSGVFAGAVEVVADAPILGLATEYALGDAQARLRAYSVPMLAF